MGSATTQANAATEQALRAQAGLDLAVASELFTAARAVSESTQLSAALADSSAVTGSRAKLAQAVFASLSPATQALVAAAAEQRWSSAQDLVAGIETLAIRVASDAAPDVDVEGEIFEFSRTVAANPELELALGGRRGRDAAKGDLVRSLLAGRTSEATTLIVSSLVQDPRERRIRQLLNDAMRTIADQRGRSVATVHSASPLTPQQTDRLVSALSARYGRAVTINTVVDPAVVGGLRVQIGDDVIDASIATRLHDLRQQLAG